MSWPHPRDPRGVEWALRYGRPTHAQLLLAASFVAAYKDLVTAPAVRQREKLAALRAALRGVESC